MRRLAASDRRSTPWKNGGGVTIEIAVSPHGAGLEAFDWRISLATVASEGPFSLFPGIDRTLTVISGVGLELIVAGERIRLDTDAPPHAFPGDMAASATLLSGPIDDFNVMTRRGLCRHHVTRHRLAADDTVLLELPEGLVFTTGACRIDGIELAARDAMLIDAPEQARIEAHGDLDLFLVALSGEKA